MVWSDAPVRTRNASVPETGLLDLQLLGQHGVPGDRLAGVDQVQVAALDRRLALELAAAAARRGQHVGAVLDHPERAAGPLDLGHEVVADGLGSARAAEGSRLVAQPLERLGRVRHGLADRLGPGLLVAHGIDPRGGRVEGRVDTGCEVLDRTPEPLDFARPGGDPRRAAEDDDQPGGQGDKAP